jgi:hypothetical protein
MTLGRPATRDGKKGHIVHVESSERFVPDTYPGTDPRTRAKHKAR